MALTHNIVRSTLIEHSMLLPEERVIVGVSGGADSIALVNILSSIAKEMGFSLVAIAHVHHGLRGKSADDDVEFCNEVASSLSLAYEVKYIDLSNIEGTCETAARNARYEFFNEVAKKHNASIIALGHHADDQAETILFNICRGAGFRGLSGIPYVRKNNDIKIIRPLLDVRRVEILNYLKEKNLLWREDETNTENFATRNRIRNNILPLLEDEVNSKVRNSLLRLKNLSKETDNYMRSRGAALLSRIMSDEINTDGSISMNMAMLNSAHPALRTATLWEAIETVAKTREGFEAIHIEHLRSMIELKGVGAKLQLPHGLEAEVEYTSLILRPFRDETTPTILMEETYEFSCSDAIPLNALSKRISSEIVALEDTKVDEIILSKATGEEWLDAASIKGKRLTVRTRRAGDRFFPLGAKGSRKLKSFFIDKRVLVKERDKVPLLLADGEIIAVIGYTVSEQVRLTSKSTEAVRIWVEEDVLGGLELEDFNLV